MIETSSAAGQEVEVRSEARGAHWVAWVAGPENGKPVGSIVLVGRTREEAEQRARTQAARFTADRPQ